MDFCLFVPHTNPHFWTDRTTHYVTSASILCHLRPSSDIFPLPNDYTDLPVHTDMICATQLCVFTLDCLLEESPRVSSSLPARVCVHHHVVTYSRHFLLRYSHATFFCNLLNALRHLRPLARARARVCVCVCVCVCLGFKRLNNQYAEHRL